MNIPDEAIDAAYDVSLHLPIACSEIEQILEAAAPHIAAQTLREASDAYPLETAYGGAEHAVTWLKQRADNIHAVPEGAAFLMPEGES